MDASPLLNIRMNCRNPLLKNESGCHEGCGYDPIVCSIGGLLRNKERAREHGSRSYQAGEGLRECL